MADIDIQEKRKSIWPWIVGLLLLLLGIWAVAEMMDGDDDLDPVTDAAEQPYQQPVADAAAPGSGTAPAEVTQFVQTCAATGAAQDQMSMDHSYVETCVRDLSAALSAVIERDTVNATALSAQLEQFRSRANQLTQQPQSTEHSQTVKQIFDNAASLIASVEEARARTGGTALERSAGLVQTAAGSISADRPLLDQRTEVQEFFNQAGAALRALSIH